jgi:hypothetical protein
MIMTAYLRQLMEPFAQQANEKSRARKRLLKENYKQCMRTHLQKAKYLPINFLLEDFYTLKGYSKQGIEQSKKHVVAKHQMPSQVARVPRRRQ